MKCCKYCIYLKSKSNILFSYFYCNHPKSGLVHIADAEKDYCSYGDFDEQKGNG